MVGGRVVVDRRVNARQVLPAGAGRVVQYELETNVVGWAREGVPRREEGVVGRVIPEEAVGIGREHLVYPSAGDLTMSVGVVRCEQLT